MDNQSIQDNPASETVLVICPKSDVSENLPTKSCFKRQKCGPAPRGDSSKPYETAFSERMGRYLIANRDIEAGEVIIEDLPLVVGPAMDVDYTCIGCYLVLRKDNITRCKGCGWSMCGLGCTKWNSRFGHCIEECVLLKKSKSGDLLLKANKSNRMHMYEALMPLRCLLLRQRNPEIWAKLLDMENHNEVRKKIKPLWASNQINIVDRIRNHWSIKDFTEEEIHTACGIIDVNSFEIGHHGVSARAIYWEPTLMAHDCQPNTSYSNNPLNYEMCVSAQRNILNGEPITLSYVYNLEGSLDRRERLQSGKYFWCQCARCSDPTECQTYLSGLKCQSCEDGLVLSNNPLDHEAFWICSSCNHKTPSNIIMVLTERIFEEVEAIDSDDEEKLENFLEKYRTLLHENHYLMLSAKLTLCQLNEDSEGLTAKDFTDDQLERREKHCRDVLHIVEKLDPGLSRLKGEIMFKLHEPVLSKAERLFHDQQISPEEFKIQINEVKELLKEAKHILFMEPAGSTEHRMAIEAEEVLREVCKLKVE